MRPLLLGALLLAGCPDANNPARQAVDQGNAKPAETPASATPPEGSAPAATTGSAPAAQAETWTCPMHPEVVQDHPGKCPKCAMDLVKKGG